MVRLVFRSVFLYCLWGIAFFMPLIAWAQDEIREDWRIWVEDYIRQHIDTDGMTAEEAAELWDELESAAAEPVDLNHITREQLELFPFLNEFQIYHFIKYRLEHPPFVTLYDLKMIEGWDVNTIRCLLPFVRLESSVGTHPLRQYHMADGRNEFLSTFSGDLGEENTDIRKYLGANYATSLRFRHRYRHVLSLALTAEKDAGEPAFNSMRKGFDAYSGHASLHDMGSVKTLILGDFRASFGHGLLLNQSAYATGVSSWLTQAPVRYSSFRPKYSTAEYGFMRGAAIHLQGNKLSLMAFASDAPHDATVKGEQITSLTSNGLHRTPAEWQRCNALHWRTWGAELAMQLHGFRIGVEGVHHSWGSFLLTRAPGSYEVPELTDLERQTLLGVFYRYRNPSGRLSVYGEAAHAATGGNAWLQGVDYHHSLWGDYKCLVRSVSNRYWAPDARSYTHYSQPHNERGIYFSARIPSPISHLTIGGFADYYQSFTPRYRQSDVTQAWDARGTADYVRASFALRLDAHFHGGHSEAPKQFYRLTGMLTPPKQPWRLSVTVQRIQTFADETNKGYSLGMKADMDFLQGRLHGALSAYTFRTDGWSSRLYVSLPRVQYDFPFAFVYDKGYQLAAAMRCDLQRHIRLAGSWRYLRRAESSPHHLFFSLLFH